MLAAARPQPERIHNNCPDDYRVAEPIGRGGVGTVYRVIHNQGGKAFAMKVLKQHVRVGDAASVRRFVRESRAMSKIHHPNVVQLVDTGHLPDGCPYLIMPLLRGTTLANIAAHGALPVHCALQIVRAVAVALIDVHAAGVVHRDLSLNNIIMNEVDGGMRPTIIDFGNAWVDDPDLLDVPDSPSGILVGTPHYISPEQILQTTVDRRSDIYSLGAIFFELLDGVPPFDDYDLHKTLRQHLHDAPPEIDSPHGVVPPEVERIVLRCLEKEPEDRYQSAAELVAELDRVLQNAFIDGVA